MHRMTGWLFLSIFRIQSTTVLALILTLLSACTDQPPQAPPLPLPQVEIITVTPQVLADEPEFIGQTEAFRPVEIRPQVSGIIKQVYFTEGRDVKKGERLYLIDPVPFKAVHLSNKAKVAQMQSRLQQAQQNLTRIKPLLDKQAVSKKEIDDAEAEVRIAKAALDEAQNDLAKIKFDLDNTVITAPVNGRIGRSQFYEGRLITAQESLLVTIAQLDPLYVSVNVPESYLLRRRREVTEQKVTSPEIFQLRGVLTFSDGSVYPHEGILDFAEAVIRPQTGTLQGRFRFPHPEGHQPPGHAYLYPGQFVKVRVKGHIRQHAILIPQRAVQQSPAGSMVFVIDENEQVQVRPVQASAWHGKDWLIESGLQPGERVVVEGFFRIMPGVKVQAVPYHAAHTNDLPTEASAGQSAP